MATQSYNIDSTSDEWNQNSSNDYSTRYDSNETPTVNSTNPYYHPTSTTNNHSFDKTNSVSETAVDKAKGELKKRSTTCRRYYYQVKKTYSTTMGTNSLFNNSITKKN